MQAGWCAITIRQETRERLKRFLAWLKAAHEEGRPTAVEPTDRHGAQPGNGVSYEQALNLLLDREERHQQRKAKSAARRRRREADVFIDAAAADVAVANLSKEDVGSSRQWDRTPRQYRGTRFCGRPVVIVQAEGQEPRVLSPRQDLRNHSPDGFEWGYQGSGPAQLALALLADATDDETAQEFYQEFKRQRIAVIPGDSMWVLDHMDVIAWVVEESTRRKGGGA